MPYCYLIFAGDTYESEVAMKDVDLELIPGQVDVASSPHVFFDLETTSLGNVSKVPRNNFAQFRPNSFHTITMTCIYMYMSELLHPIFSKT